MWPIFLAIVDFPIVFDVFNALLLPLYSLNGLLCCVSNYVIFLVMHTSVDGREQGLLHKKKKGQPIFFFLLSDIPLPLRRCRRKRRKERKGKKKRVALRYSHQFIIVLSSVFFTKLGFFFLWLIFFYFYYIFFLYLLCSSFPFCLFFFFSCLFLYSNWPSLALVVL